MEGLRMQNDCSATLAGKCQPNSSACHIAAETQSNEKPVIAGIRDARDDIGDYE